MTPVHPIKENKMDETTPTIVEKPTLIEKIKANKKVIITRIAIIGGTALGLIAAAILIKKVDDGDFEDNPDVDYVVIEVPKDESTPDSITAE
jgi:hypothetical protein